MAKYIVYFHGSKCVEAEYEQQAEELVISGFPLAEGEMEFTVTSANEIEKTV